MSLVLKSNKRALRYISSDPRLPADYSLMLNFEGGEYKNGGGISVNPKSYVNYSRKNTASMRNEKGAVASFPPDSLAVVQLSSGEQGLYLAGFDEDAYVPIFTRPMDDGTVSYKFNSLTWRKYQFAMVGSGRATITITLPTGVTMNKYPSGLASSGNQFDIDEENPTACEFSGSGGEWSIKVEANGRIDQLFVTRKNPAGEFMMYESSRLVKPSAVTASTLRVAEFSFNSSEFDSIFSGGAKYGTVVFSLHIPLERNLSGLVGANPGWLIAMLLSDGSDISLNAYTNPKNEPDNITRYRINDKTANTEKTVRFMPERALTVAISFDNGIVKIACNNKYYDETTLSPGISLSDIWFGKGVWGKEGYYGGNLLIKKIYAYSRPLSSDELMDASGLFL
ncbi:hypothetical protein DMW62_05485 [Serratia marcescens]|uniref:IgGFc-binding protein N-terminal domain-containing protein n=1 Tax=Serratia marcescens TaxID=615 RepID=A0ABX5NJR7_SERMA|nr:MULTISPECIES: hypothetical protein [Serratia]MDI9107909.1 hypothetical protein [Serratia marcescens]MDR8535425.1 hypothetical protein [Serratia nevei]PYA18430.1 hypothetical protein DMW42_00610 [Serratia marcescens]PYA25080.1 hypothetical protein DMW41_09120 [Serratia marcescens]PYA31719.1 hypothetical protein DMW40_00610 [Serratia marcescens]